MIRFARFDRFVCDVEILDAAADRPVPLPGHAKAYKTPEGYLVVDALLARDGLLEYSDGRNRWMEYRPRAELEASSLSFAHAPVTDEHPKRMVDATSYATVAKGHGIGTPAVVVIGDRAYIRDQLRITDAELIAKIESGKQAELSIGFTSVVQPTATGFATDGTRCDAVQTQLLGNHVASVAKGRAGPMCRPMLDSAAWTPEEDYSMTTKTKQDELGGMPLDQAEIVGPDGQKAMVPQWVAALLQQAMAAAPPPAPQANAVGEPPPAPAAPAVPAAAPEEEKSKDSGFVLVSRRKLDRLAMAAGVSDEILDSADDCAVARALLAKLTPSIKTDSLTAGQLDALVYAAPAAATPAATPAAVTINPWPLPAAIVRKTDAVDELSQKFLARGGVGV